MVAKNVAVSAPNLRGRLAVRHYAARGIDGLFFRRVFGAARGLPSPLWGQPRLHWG